METQTQRIGSEPFLYLRRYWHNVKRDTKNRRKRACEQTFNT